MLRRFLFSFVQINSRYYGVCVCFCGGSNLQGDNVNSSHCCLFLCVCWNWDIGSSGAWWEWCRCLACSQSEREREKKKTSRKMIGPYVIRATGQVLSFCSAAVFAALICRRAPGVETICRRFSCMGVGAVLNEKGNRKLIICTCLHAGSNRMSIHNMTRISKTITRLKNLILCYASFAFLFSLRRS